MTRIIQADRSVIPACDVDFGKLKDIVRETAGIEKIGGYKLGVAFLDALKAAVETVKEQTDKPLIYDHQKAGTDIPDTAGHFMDAMVRAGVDAVILFPLSGPITQYEWTLAAQKRNLGVIVGGEMTHPRYSQGDIVSGKNKDYDKVFREIGLKRQLSGYIRKNAPDDIYDLAARMGVTDFVMPGNKPDRIRHYKELVELCSVEEPVIWSPGLVAQGGKVSEGAKVAGKRFHAIVGRGITKADDIKKAAEELTSQL